MTTLLSRFVLPGALFLVTLLSGIWLVRFGRPLNAAIMALHKIAAVVTVILLSVAVYRLAGHASISAVEGIALAVAILMGLLLFVSGALLSFDKLALPALVVVHKVAPLLTAIAAATALYLLAAAAA